jgi:hypothetical protein
MGGRNMAGGGRKGSAERGGEEFKPRIPERVGRWPEGEGEYSDRVEPSLATVRAAVCIGPEHAERKASTVSGWQGPE